nr:immunoglobulin heavy chain junction region [Mus musculus]
CARSDYDGTMDCW